MKSLESYILESIDSNIFYLLDLWFVNNEDEKQEFVVLISEYGKLKIPKKDDVKKLIDNTTLLKSHLKEFVNFIDNDINAPLDKDYYQKMKSILDIVLANKSRKI